MRKEIQIQCLVTHVAVNRSTKSFTNLKEKVVREVIGRSDEESILHHWFIEIKFLFL